MEKAGANRCFSFEGGERILPLDFCISSSRALEIFGDGVTADFPGRGLHCCLFLFAAELFPNNLHAILLFPVSIELCCAAVP
jgi:hypothetical protein